MTCAVRPRALAAAIAALLGAACSWSVPADPGENQRLRGRPAPERATVAARPGPPGTSTPPSPAADEVTRAVYLRRCGQCHEPFPPSHAAASEWPGLVRKYGPRAGLFGAERERVVRWLQGRSR